MPIRFVDDHARPSPRVDTFRGWRSWSLPRRDMVRHLTLGLLGSFGASLGLSCASKQPRPGVANAHHPAPANPRRENAESEDQALETDLTRLSGRAYSEQGISTFLVCENLAQGEAPREPGFARGRESAALARAFERQVKSFQRLHPDRTKDDVAKLVEVLADRDFGAPQAEVQRPNSNIP